MALVHINDAVAEMLEGMVNEIERLGSRTRVPTGLPNLDDQYGGVRPGSLVGCVIADDPVRHDLAAALSLWHACRGADVVLAFPGTYANDVASRLLASASHVPLWRLETGQLSREDWISIASAAGTLSARSLHLAPSATGEQDRGLADQIVTRMGGSATETVLIAVDVPDLLAALFDNDTFSPALAIIFEERRGDQSTPFSVRLEHRTGKWILSLEGHQSHAVQLPYDPLRRTFPTISQAFLEPEPTVPQAEDEQDDCEALDDWDHLIELPEERRLEEEPPPRAGLRHLTQDELKQVIAWARQRASEIEDPTVEPVIALFLAEVLPYLKYASHAGQDAAGITRDEMSQAVRATHGGSVDYTPVDLLELCGCLTQYTKAGHYGGQWRAATYRIVPGTIEFSNEAPKTRIHPHPAASALEGRWNALQRAACEQPP